MNYSLTFLTVLSVLASSLAAATDVPLNDIQVRVFIDNQDQWQQLRALEMDVVWTDSTFVDIITNPEELDQVQRAGFKTETVHASVGEFYRSRLPQAHMGGYKTLSELYEYLDGIIAAHPDIVSPKQSIGLTILGRDMWAVKISDNPTVDEEEPEVLFTAGIHCREVGTPEILFYFMNHLTDNYGTNPEITQLVDSREIWLIIASNPDGYWINETYAPDGGGMWRKNFRDNGDGTYGVDLNRNFGYMWGYDNVGSSPLGGYDTYRGTGPFSEPETQNLRDFIISHDFSIVCQYHQYQNVLIYPWGYQASTCPDDSVYSAMGDTISAMNGYAHGPVSTLMYRVNGGSFDWEYGDQVSKPKIFGTTIEAGTGEDGFWPTLERLEVLKQENLRPMLFLTRLAGDLYSPRPPKAPEIVNLPPSVDGSEYQVAWSHLDNYNPAVRYELTEFQKRRVATDRCETFSGWNSEQFAVSSTRAWSLPGSLYSGTGNSYTARLTTSFPYLVRPNDKLTFNTFINTEPHRDYCYVEVSTDGQSFTSLPGDITSDFNPYGGNHGNGITGMYYDWQSAEFDLSAFAGEEVWFRFVYETNGNNFYEGWYLDDVYPHLVFDSIAVISSDIHQLSYTFTNKPMGLHAYGVRAQDAEDQWGPLSLVANTDVLGEGIGDIDLDGVNSSVADLAAFSLYFDKGLPAFDIYPDVQVAETDADCDGLTLTAQDLDVLAQVVVGSQTACYASGSARFERSLRSPMTGSSNGRLVSALRAGSNPAFKVELQSTSFQNNDSAWADIVLTQSTAGLLGFQFHLEFDASALVLEAVQAGSTLLNWQFFDHDLVQTSSTADLRIAAVAQYQGGTILADDIDLQPTPVTLVHLKFGFLEPDLVEPVSFAWDNCGDNALVCGRLQGETLFVDSLLVSRSVFDSDGADITALDPRFGGADYTCFYDLFGNTPAAAVDFANGVVTYDLGCCVGRVGDANGSNEPADEVTLADIMLLVDVKFVSGDCSKLLCLAEADVNQDGGADPNCEDHVTLGDIMALVDFLFITGAAIPPCL